MITKNDYLKHALLQSRANAAISNVCLSEKRGKIKYKSKIRRRIEATHKFRLSACNTR
jgi:hypothetical protein